MAERELTKQCKNDAQQNNQDAKKEPTLFPIGAFGSSVMVLRVLQGAGVHPLKLLARHSVGDWGELGEKDKKNVTIQVENLWYK